MSEDAESALRTSSNVLRDSIETGRMRSGLTLGVEALTMHAAAIAERERLITSVISGRA